MGNRAEVEEWFFKYGDDVYNFLVYYTKSHDVEDIVQDVFLKALKSANHFEGRASPKTWLLAIARRLVIDRYRKEKRQRFIPFELLGNNRVPIVKQLTEDLVIGDETLSEIYKHVNSLKRSHRNVLICRLILEYSVQETCEILGWSKAKVSLTYHRALGSLKKNLSNMTEGGVANE